MRSGLLRENVAYRLEEATSRTLRIVDATIVKGPGKTGSQWRILYSIALRRSFSIPQLRRPPCCSPAPRRFVLIIVVENTC
jgi:hypothetical protein